jgi:hypothetical protein
MADDTDNTHDSVAAAAKFASLAFIMLVRHLEKNGSLQRVHFFSRSIEAFERNKDWPRDGQPVTFH